MTREQLDSIRARVEAATPVVEWHEHSGGYMTAYPNDSMELSILSLNKGERFMWTIRFDHLVKGECATLDEAKAAAIAAAKGIK